MHGAMARDMNEVVSARKHSAGPNTKARSPSSGAGFIQLTVPHLRRATGVNLSPVTQAKNRSRRDQQHDMPCLLWSRASLPAKLTSANSQKANRSLRRCIQATRTPPCERARVWLCSAAHSLRSSVPVASLVCQKAASHGSISESLKLPLMPLRLRACCCELSLTLADQCEDMQNEHSWTSCDEGNTPMGQKKGFLPTSIPACPLQLRHVIVRRHRRPQYGEAAGHLSHPA